MLEAIAVTRPYPGLRPFEPHEGEIFFGREEHVDRLLEILQRERFLAVIGPSGCGKSSLVRAGLLPAVAAGWLGTGTDWRIVIMRPGDRPITELARGLVRPEALGAELDPDNRSDAVVQVEAELLRGRRGLVDLFRTCGTRVRDASQLNLLVLVDQFEELFTFAKGGDAQADESTAFVDLLLETRSHRDVGLHIVLTMRTDFLGNCVRFLDLPDAINRAQYLTPRLHRDEMREAIIGPAGLFGKGVDEQLVGQLINSIGSESDQLPILQHALSRMWERAGDNPMLTEEHLCEVGGVADALSKHATDVFEGLPGPRDRELAEHLFRFITERTSPEDGGRDVRRPRSLQQIAAAKEGTDWTDFKRIVEDFAGEGVNFLTFTLPLKSQKKIDISHEALIRKWDLLQKWVADEATRAAEYREWRSRAMKNQQGEEGLLGGIALARATRWAEGDGRTKPTARWAARYAVSNDPDAEFAATVKFIQASKEEDARVRRQDEDARLAKATAKRMRRALSYVLAFALLAIAGAVMAITGWQRASAVGKRASKAELRARAAEKDAKEEAHNAKLATAEAKKQARLAADEKKAAIAAQGVANANAEAATAAAKRAVIAEQEATRLAQTRQLISDSEKHEKSDPERSQLLAVAAYNLGRIPETESRIRAIRLAFSDLLMTYRGHGEDGLATAAISPDGKVVLTAGTDGVVHTWEAATAKQLLTISIPQLTTAQLTPDGNAIVTQTPISIKSWRARTGEPLWPLSIESGFAMTFAPDGKIFAVVKDDGSVGLFETSSGKHLQTLPTEIVAAALQYRPDGTPPARPISFSPDGKRLVTPDSESSASVWNVETGDLLGKLTGHADDVECAEFSPDGKWIVTGSDDSTARLWNATTYKQVGKPMTHGELEWVTKISFEPTGNFIITVTDEGLARVWELPKQDDDEPTPVELKGHGGRILDAMFSPDGTQLLTASADSTVRIWIRANEATTLTGHSGPVVATSFSRDGTKIITASTDGTARLWRAVNGTTLHAVSSAKFGPDGKTIITASPVGFAGLWYGSRQIAELDTKASAGAFSPDGQSIITTSSNGTATIWNAATRQKRADIRWDDDTSQNTGPSSAPHSRNDSKKSYFSEILATAPQGGFAVFSPDGTIVATAGAYTPRLWNASNGALIRALPRQEAKALQVAFHPDGKSIAIAREDGKVRLFDIGGHQLGTFEEYDEPSTVSFSSDGHAILTFSISDSAVYLRRRDRGFPVRLDHGVAVSHAEFSRDGRKIITAGGDGIARIWSVDSGRQLVSLTGHRGMLTYATLSRDGEIAVTSSIDGTTRLWSTATGKPLQVLSGRQVLVRYAEFSSDQASLLTVDSMDSTARIWDVSPATESIPEMLRQIKMRVPRELTKEELDDAHLQALDDKRMRDTRGR